MAFDGAIKSLMQGVSQQVPRERLDGQVSVQLNRLSDVVNGNRRRPGARYLSTLPITANFNNRVFATYVDVADATNHVLVNTEDGQLVVLSEDFGTVLHTGTYPYLQASNANAIQTGTLRGDLYLANTQQAPTLVHGTTTQQDPTKTGFFFVRVPAFSKDYDITLSNSTGTYTYTHRTPNGQGGGDADLAKPSYVVSQLVSLINAETGTHGITAHAFDAYMYLVSTTATLSATTNAGSTYATASNQSRVALLSDLPARLPTIADGTLCAVGTTPRSFTWYEYESSTSVWKEAGAYGSPTGFSGMPIKLSLDGTYTVSTPEYEGRLAGSDITNEDPGFIEHGLTGFGVYQGRLVILAGPEVCMSASGRPERWYRSTVTSLLTDDPINVFSGAATTTNFSHCVQFNKDLLLFSRSCQAVVPSSNAAITPATAQIVITSQYTTDTLAAPTVVGRSVLYPMPRTESFAGILEMIPSNTTDSQYTSNDVTAHIPRYMPGSIRSITASTTSNSSVLLCTGDDRSLFVQDYLWSGDEKVQSAWHQWGVPYPIVCAWFVRDRVCLGMRDGTSIVVGTIEPQAGTTYLSYTRPFSDLYSLVTVSGGLTTVPQHLRGAYLSGAELFLTFADTSKGGMWVGIDSVDTGTWQVQTVRNVPDGQYFLGVRYMSVLTPTPPLVRDANGVVIGTSRTLLVRYELTLKDSGEFHAVVADSSRVLTDGTYSSLVYSNVELLPDEPTSATLGRVVIPVRAQAQETVATFEADSDTDLCILDIEYVLQYRARRKRL
ncbi:tail tubular protein [Pectobacterium phage CX5-1]|nr:tail tubular protein [Pectobacterium phage CX5-1]